MNISSNEVHIDTTRLPVVKISGKVGFTNVEDIALKIESAAGSASGEIVLDMSSVESIDSYGLKMLVDCKKRLSEQGCEMKIKSASGGVTRALQLSGLADIFGIPNLVVEQGGVSHKKEDRHTTDWNIYESVALCEPQLIKPLTEVAVDAAREAGLNAGAVTDVQLAVGEALVNALQHGTPKRTSSKIRLKCLSCYSAIVFEVTDEGNEFDYEHILADGLNAPEHEAIGIRLITNAMDEVEYKHTENGNCIRMIKWITP